MSKAPVFPPEDTGAPHYLSHRERLRERFRAVGGDALADYELLELIMIPRREGRSAG